MEKLFYMIAAHFLCDYPLQGDWLAKAKNPTINLIGETIWPMALFGHAMIHASAVLIITGMPALAASELVIHAITDYTKCKNGLTYNGDQTVHLVCKMIWAIIYDFMQ